MVKSILCAIVFFASISMLLGRDTIAARMEQQLTRIDTSVLMNTNRYMRIARVVVDSAKFTQYHAALRDGMQLAVRNEPGVLNLWAVSERSNPTHIPLFEIYPNVA